jgi:PilZ domain
LLVFQRCEIWRLRGGCASVTDDNPTGHGQPAPHDDRLDPRYEGRLEAFLVFRGAPWRCWIRDLSLGGAGLEPALPATLGQMVELTCPSFEFDGGLSGRVVNVADRRTCIAFELEAQRLDDLARFLAANIETV